MAKLEVQIRADSSGVKQKIQLRKLKKIKKS
jgi:hypothetical protein